VDDATAAPTKLGTSSFGCKEGSTEISWAQNAVPPLAPSISGELEGHLEAANGAQADQAKALHAVQEVIKDLADHRDSLSEQGREQQRRMEEILRRMAKAARAAAAAEKEFSEIASGLIQNFK
jgi:hypothetical protein